MIDEKSNAVFKKETVNLPVYESFARYRIDLGMGSILRPIHMYLAMCKLYHTSCLVLD